MPALHLSTPWKGSARLGPPGNPRKSSILSSNPAFSIFYFGIFPASPVYSIFCPINEKKKKWRGFFLLAGVLALAASAALAQPGAAASLRIGPDGGYMKDRGASRVLVFVHGFSGDAATDFRCDDSHDWPAMIAADPDDALASTDIYLLGYEPPSHRGKSALADLETALVGRMQADGVFSRHQQVIFVAHAMGGLLVQQILDVNAGSDWTKKVRAVFLFGTPRGSDKLSGLGRFLPSDPRFKELDRNGNNFLLHPADARWTGTSFFCAYESLSDDGFSAVNYNGATRGCTDLLAVHANRDNIVKPCQANDAAYTFLEDKLRTLTPRNSQ